MEPEWCVTGTPDVSQVVSEPVDGVSSDTAASDIVLESDMSQPEQPFFSSVEDGSSTRQPLEHAEVTEAGDIQDLSTEIVGETSRQLHWPISRRRTAEKDDSTDFVASR